jgi:adenine phosphoribosyltransferase
MSFRRYVRNWPGVARSDLTHLLAQPALFPAIVEALAGPYLDQAISHVATVDAGGFPLGGAVAYRLGAGCVLIRKGGNITWETRRAGAVDFSGQEKELEITADALGPADRVLVVDDWSETGGQLIAAISLVEQFGATVVGAACLHLTPAVLAHPRLAAYHLTSLDAGTGE